MLREKLRTETAAQHESLEKKLGILETVNSTGAYIRLLERFHGFVAPLEARIEKGTDWKILGFDIDSRRKAHSIKRDLEVLGQSREEILALPICSNLPNILGIPQALGSLYVLEGSTLGGQILSRHFKETLGVTPERGCEYFSGYGKETGKMWQAFIAFLNLQEPEIRDPSEVVNSARETFATLEKWIEKTY